MFSPEHRAGQPPQWLVHLAYGLPAAALSFPLIPFAVYLPVRYAEDLGLGFLVVGVVLFLSRLVDVISDPLAGFLSDTRTVTLASRQFGRRKPWMVGGSLVAGTAFYMLSTATPGVSATYLGLWSAALYIGWTFVMVPYLALGADIASSYEENTKLAGLREGFGLVGILIALSMPLFIEGDLLPTLPSLLLPVGAITMIILLLLTPDPPSSAEIHAGRVNWMAVLNARPMRDLSIAWFLTATASAIPAALFPLYVSDVLQDDENAKNLAIFLYFAFAALGMPFWSRFAKGKPKHRVMAQGMALVCGVFALAVLLSAGDTPIFYVICCITGFALAAELVLGPSILADIAALSQARHGKDTTAVHFALWGVISKLAFAFAILIAFGLLAAIDTAAPTELRPFAVAFLYAGMPVALKLPSLLHLRRLPFSAEDRDLAYAKQRKDV